MNHLKKQLKSRYETNQRLDLCNLNLLLLVHHHCKCNHCFFLTWHNPNHTPLTIPHILWDIPYKCFKLPLSFYNCILYLLLNRRGFSPQQPGTPACYLLHFPTVKKIESGDAVHLKWKLKIPHKFNSLLTDQKPLLMIYGNKKKIDMQ